MPKFAPIALFALLVACASLVSVQGQCNCNAINWYDPVCGTDGRTYNSDDLLRCLNVCNRRAVGKAYDGACGAPT